MNTLCHAYLCQKLREVFLENKNNSILHDISVLITSASSEVTGESAQMRRLARVLAARIHNEYL